MPCEDAEVQTEASLETQKIADLTEALEEALNLAASHESKDHHVTKDVVAIRARALVPDRGAEFWATRIRPANTGRTARRFGLPPGGGGGCVEAPREWCSSRVGLVVEPGFEPSGPWPTVTPKKHGGGPILTTPAIDQRRAQAADDVLRVCKPPCPTFERLEGLRGASETARLGALCISPWAC